MLKQLSLLAWTPVLQEILRVLPEIHILRSHRFLHSFHLCAKCVVSRNLALDETSRPNLVDTDLVDDTEKLRNEMVLTHERILAGLVSTLGTRVVDIPVRRAVFEGL